MIQILYVDDEEDLLEVAKDFLELSEDMSVDTVTSAKAASSRLSIKKYDAIISDYQMPIEDGIEFLKHLRAHGDATPFILFTGKGREEVVIEALNEGADFYLQKGGKPDSLFKELEHKIREAVRRSKAESDLRENEERLRNAQAISHTGCFEIWIDTSKEMNIWGSEEFFRLFGLSRPDDGIIPLSTIESMQVEWERVHQACLDLVRHNKEYDMEFEVAPADGAAHKILHAKAEAIRDNDGRAVKIVGAVQDITITKSMEGRLHRYNRQIMTIKECDLAIARAESEEELLQKICQIACRIGGYRLAWIVYPVVDGTREVRTVAWEGVDEEFIRETTSRWGTDAIRNGPTWQALNTGRMSFIQDWEKDPRTAPWRAAAQKNGYRSSISLPLVHGSKTMGAIALYSSLVNGFTQDEINLLEEMVSDLARGIQMLRDRDEKKRAEVQLGESEQKFYKAFHGAAAAMALSRLSDGMYVEVNDRWLGMYGFEREEVIGRTSDELNVWTAPTGRRETIDELVRSGSTFDDSEINFRKKNGEIWTALCSGRVINLQGEKMILASMIDITAWIDARKALKVSETKYRGLFNNINAVMMLIDPSTGDIIEANPEALAFYGYDHDRITKMKISEINCLPKEQILGKMNQAIRKETQTFSFPHKLASGEIRNVEVYSGPVVVDEKTLLCSIIIDKTKNIGTEKALIESEAKFRGIFNLATDVIFIADHNGQLLEVNNAACDQLGYSRDELLRMRTMDVASSDKARRAKEYLDKIKKDGHMLFETVMVTRNGEQKNVEINALSIDFQGSPAILCVVRDITDRNKMAEELRRNEVRNRALFELSQMSKLSPREIAKRTMEYCIELSQSRIGHIAFLSEDESILSMQYFMDDTKECDMRDNPPAFRMSSAGMWTEAVRRKAPFILNDYEAPNPLKKGLPKGHASVKRFMSIPVIDHGHVAAVVLVGNKGTDYSREDVADISLIMDNMWRIIRKIQAEEEIQSDRFQLDIAMDTALLAYWEYDEASNTYLFNDRFYNLYGTTAQMESGYVMSQEKYYRDFIHPNDLDYVLEMASKAPDFYGNPMHFQHRIIRRDGEVRYIAVFPSHITNEEGKVVKIFGVNQDITDLKRANEDLKKVTEQLSLLTSITRHDIMNQLMVQQGNLELLKSSVTDPKVLVRVQKIENSISTVKKQIEFSKDYEKMGAISPQWQSVAAVLQDLPDVRDTESIDQCKVEGLEVYADPMFNKVFHNLIENSVKYCGRKVEASVFCLKDGADLLLVYEDKGVGIPMEEKEEIFKKGYGRGTGLGLFLSKEILRITDITIIENGRQGEGARFEMRVPKGNFRFT